MARRGSDGDARGSTACYARVSTDEQNHDAQLHDLKRAAEQFAGPVAWYKDTVSGAADTRPELERLTKDIAKGRHGRVIVFALDRISRRGIIDGLRILKRWLNAGVEVHSIREPWVASTADPAMRELLLSIAFWGARQERNRIRERTKAGLAAARARGVRLGRRPGTRVKWSLAKRRVDPQLARSLREQGVPVADIAAKFRCSRGAVYAALKESIVDGE